MAVVSVNKTMPFGAGGEWTSTSAIEQETLTETYIVVLDGADANDESLIIARDAAGIPVRGQAHADYPTYILNKKTVEPTMDFKTFLVQCEFSTSTSTLIQEESPYDDPWIIDFPDEITKKIVTKTVLDLSGGSWAANEVGIAANQPIENAAKDPVETPPEEDYYPGVVTMSKNVRTSNISLAEMKAYRGTLNDADITVAGYLIPKWYGRIVGMSGSYQNDRNEEYYRLTYRVKIEEEPWMRRIMNKGWTYLNGSGEKVKCRVKGDFATAMVHLKSDGTDHSGRNPAITFNYRLFGTLKETDWSALTTTMPTSL